MIIRVVTILALLGCGRVNYDERDAGSVADVMGFAIDATVFGDGVAAPECGTNALLGDDFADGTPGPLFFTYTGSGLTLSEPGHMQVTFAATVPSGNYAGYKSSVNYPVEGLCATVEVLAAPNGEGNMYLKLWSQTQQLEFFEHNNLLDLRTHMGNAVATVETLAFDPGRHRFWRLRQQGGVSYWDTSADGVQFVQHASTTFLTVTMVAYELGGGAFGTVTNAGSARFDNALLTGP